MGSAPLWMQHHGEVMRFRKLLFLIKKVIAPIPEGAPEESPAVENPQNKESTGETDIKTTVDPETG